MTIVKAELWHFGAIEEDNRAKIVANVVDRDMYASVYSKLPGSFTLLSGSVILGIGGLMPLWPGVGEVWMVWSKQLNESPSSVRAIKRKFDEISQGYHRVHGMCRSGDERCARWFKWLGFTLETTHKQYGPDKADYDVYVRLR